MRATGWKPVRSEASWTSTDTPPYAFVDGAAKKRSATSRCTITVHSSSPGMPVEALDDDRRRDVVGQVRDQLRRRRIERGEVELERVAPVELDVRALGECREVRRKRPVELDCVDVSGAVGEAAGEDAEAGPDLEHDVVAVELGQSLDHAEDVLVDEEVLAELLLRANAHGRRNAAAALASIRAASSAGSSPRTPASAATVWTTFAGSFGRPRTG